jgi:hypothetical protein
MKIHGAVLAIAVFWVAPINLRASAFFSSFITATISIPQNADAYLIQVIDGETILPDVIRQDGSGLVTRFTRVNSIITITPQSVVLNMSAMVEGMSGPGPGFAEAETEGTSAIIRITNISLTPENFLFNGNAEYSLKARADADSMADASLGVLVASSLVETGGFGDGMFAPPNQPDKSVSRAFPFGTGDIPSMRSADITMRVFVRGSALTGVPEPSSLFLGGIGTAALAILLRRRKAMCRHHFTPGHHP